MFCTSCGAANPNPGTPCPACHAPGAAPPSLRSRSGAAPARARLLRWLYALPLAIAVFLVAATMIQTERRQSGLATAYEAAVRAEQVHDFPAAVTGFTEVGAYRDATARRDEAAARLQPFSDAYEQGVVALDAGDYDTAIDRLQEVARNVPTYADAPARLADARRLLVGSLWRSVESATSRHDWPAAEASLRRIQTTAPDPRAAAELATIGRQHGPLVMGRDHDLWIGGIDGADDKLVSDQAPVLWPTWSPDRGRIAFLSYDPKDPTGNVALCVVAVDGSGFRRLADDVSAHAPPVWSPDGERIAYTSFGDYNAVTDTGPISVRFFDLPTGHEVDVTGDRFSLAFNPSWSPDGRQIAFVSKERAADQRPQEAPGDVRLATLGRAGFRDLTNGRLRNAWSVAWSPVESKILVYSLTSSNWYDPPATAIDLLDPRSGAIRAVDPGDDPLSAPLWSPNGQSFAFARGSQSVVIVENGLQTAFDLKTDLSGDLTWSPDSHALIALPIDPTTGARLIELDRQPAVTPITLRYDSERPFFAPPQWAPVTAMPPPAPPTVGGTTLDASDLLRPGG